MLHGPGLGKTSRLDFMGRGGQVLIELHFRALRDLRVQVPVQLAADEYFAIGMGKG